MSMQITTASAIFIHSLNEYKSARQMGLYLPIRSLILVLYTSIIGQYLVEIAMAKA